MHSLKTGGNLTLSVNGVLIPMNIRDGFSNEAPGSPEASLLLLAHNQ